MEHLVILKKKYFDLIKKGVKKVESRWYKTKRDPWDNISIGDYLYFKCTGGYVELKAKVIDIIQYEKLDEEKVKEIILHYGEKIGIQSDYINEVNNKKYCILIFFDNLTTIDKFKVNKSGFGLMSAWISIEDINYMK